MPCVPDIIHTELTCEIYHLPNLMICFVKTCVQQCTNLLGFIQYVKLISQPYLPDLLRVLRHMDDWCESDMCIIATMCFWTELHMINLGQIASNMLEYDVICFQKCRHNKDQGWF